MLQSFHTLFQLDRIAQMFHQNVQDDKRPAPLAVSRLMEAAGAQYVISGGLAADLMQLLLDSPGLYEQLRALLDAVHADSQVTFDPYPDFDEACLVLIPIVGISVVPNQNAGS